MHLRLLYRPLTHIWHTEICCLDVLKAKKKKPPQQRAKNSHAPQRRLLRMAAKTSWLELLKDYGLLYFGCSSAWVCRGKCRQHAVLEPFALFIRSGKPTRGQGQVKKTPTKHLCKPVLFSKKTTRIPAFATKIWVLQEKAAR